jgi:hypothetical protein
MQVAASCNPITHIDYLNNLIQVESDSPTFEPMPFHYIEIASILISVARATLLNIEVIRAALETLKNA